MCLRVRKLASLAVLGAALVLVVPAAVDAAAKTVRVNKNSSGQVSNDHASAYGISRTGRYVVFYTSATNVAPGDGNGLHDVFLRDRATGVTRLVSRTPGGASANAESGYATISANGQFVVFSSSATNLVAGDTNAAEDIFIYNRRTRNVRRVSVSSGEAQGNAQSGYDAAVSADGRFVAFLSSATNLVPGDTNAAIDVFVRDRKLGQTRRVSVNSNGAQTNAGGAAILPGAISSNGRYVVFASLASNLVPGDANGAQDVFVRDRREQTTRRMSVASGGAQADAASGGAVISGDGHIVVFTSGATNLAAGDTNGTGDVFVRNRATKRTSRVSVGAGGAQGNAMSGSPAVSETGRFVAFDSAATNLVAGDTNTFADAFVRDRSRKTTRRVNVGPSGAQANSLTSYPFISGDGRFVSFSSLATTLIAGDADGQYDVFVRGPLR